MNKEFIKYEQALELKELEFDEPCFGCYDEKGVFGLTVMSIKQYYTNSKEDTWNCSAPLYQQAFRWFRERYLLHYEVACGDNVFWFRYGKNGHISVLSIDTNNDSYWSTYEEAELACLKKLIEIVKGGNK
jgi:hypothetical protein